MRAPTLRISRLDFINSAMSTAAARASAADLPRTFGSALASQRSARERLPEDSGEYFLVALSWKLSAYNRGSRDRDLRFGHMKQVESPLAVRLNRVFCRNPVSEKIAGDRPLTTLSPNDPGAIQLADMTLNSRAISPSDPFERWCLLRSRCLLPTIRQCEMKDRPARLVRCRP